MNTKNPLKLTWLTNFGLSSLLAMSGLAGTPQKWEQLPEAVRVAVLAHGGKPGPVDLESGKRNGFAVYEAQVKDNKGSLVDLVITADGKLVESKTDDPLNKSAKVAAANPAAIPTFSHPRDITNPYLPLASLKQDILEGKEGGKKIRIERTVKPELRQTFKIGKQKVETLVVEDREYEDGELTESTTDYFAQADDGTVYYLGEKVDEYKNGKIVGHSGAWMYGKDTKNLTPLMPGQPKPGDKFRSEDVSKTIFEEDEVLSMSESVTVPTGKYNDCLKIKELLADGQIEYKYFAKGIGCVREVPAEGDVLLTSHTTR